MTPTEFLKKILSLPRLGKWDRRHWESWIRNQCSEDDRIALFEKAAETYYQLSLLDDPSDSLQRLEWIMEIATPVSDHTLRGNLRFIHHALKDD